MIAFAARTDVGSRGGENEDAMGWDPERRVWFIADGMGGHVAGQVASAVVKTTLLSCGSGHSIGDALLRAHDAIVEQAEADPQLDGMGSTAVVARIDDGMLEVTWVGDSRAYLYRKGRLRQLTRDHSLLEVLREQKILSESEIRNHPQKNLITNTLGRGAPEPSVVRARLRAGDLILLCSDGLNDELEEREIADILAQSGGLQAAAEGLVEAALRKGGRDNTTVVTIAFEGSRIRDMVYVIMGIPWLPIAIGACMALVVAALLWGKG